MTWVWLTLGCFLALQRDYERAELALLTAIVFALLRLIHGPSWLRREWERAKAKQGDELFRGD